MRPSAILNRLTWPLTIAGAVALIGISADGTFSLVSESASRVASEKLNGQTYAERHSMSVTMIKVPAAAMHLEPAVVPLATITSSTPAQPQMMVAVSSLAVRKVPAKSGAMVADVLEGQMVTVMGEKGSWLLVRTASGREGWVYGKYLAPVAELAPEVQ